MSYNTPKNSLMKYILCFCLAFSFFSTSLYSNPSPVGENAIQQTTEKSDSTRSELISVTNEKSEIQKSNEKDKKPKEENNNYTMMSMNIVYYIVHKYLQNRNFDN